MRYEFLFSLVSSYFNQPLLSQLSNFTDFHLFVINKTIADYCNVTNQYNSGFQDLT